MFNYPAKIKISPAKITSTLPMQYGAVVGSPAHKKKLKRKRELEMINAESGKGYDELKMFK